MNELERLQLENTALRALCRILSFFLNKDAIAAKETLHTETLSSGDWLDPAKGQAALVRALKSIDLKRDPTHLVVGLIMSAETYAPLKKAWKNHLTMKTNKATLKAGFQARVKTNLAVEIHIYTYDLAEAGKVAVAMFHHDRLAKYALIQIA